MRAALLGPAACGLGLSSPAADARVARVDVNRREGVADDQPFGMSGACGNFSGRVRLEVERGDEGEARVYELGPRNARAHLRERFGPGWNRASEALALADDLRDLAWLGKDFALRTPWAGTISTPDGTRVPGRLHLFPIRHPDHDAEASHRWRQARDAGIQENRLDADSRGGPRKARPFTGLSIRGRDIPWSEWGTQP